MPAQVPNLPSTFPTEGLPPFPQIGYPPDLPLPTGRSGSGLILSKALGLAGPIGTIAQGIGTIAAPIVQHQQQMRERDVAASVQRAIEKVAMDIQTAVNNGQMDVDAALSALRGLQPAGGVAGTPSQTGNAMSSLIVQQVIANLESKRTTELSRPFSPVEGPRPNLTGSPEFQRSRMGTGLRNYLMGTPLGEEVADTPLAKLTQPVRGPLDRFKEISPIAQEFQPVDFTRLNRRQVGETKF